MGVLKPARAAGQLESGKMGTRADFYIGRGQDAEWLGSVGWDGCEWEEGDSALMKAMAPDEFRAAVATIQAEREDFTTPGDGWPWPWDDSCTTDYSYVLHDGKVWVYHFGSETFVNEAGEIDSRDEKEDWFPDMSVRKNVAWGARSGIIVVSA
jgi:hypothetical protein